jgi:hypothetical protein
MDAVMGMMGPMMGLMMEGMMDSMLTYLSKPENTDRLATYLWNYYNALIKKGFSKEEALQIVTTANMLNTMSLK